MSKKVKLASILKDKECPFGLKIPYACKNVGEIIHRMAPVDILSDEAEEDEILALVRANRKLCMLQADGTRCAYAGKIFEEKEAVECNFDSDAPGERSYNLEPSKFYSKVYDNIALDGLYSYPMGWYGDNNISRNTYYGLWSAQGSKSSDLNKTASENKDIEEAVQHAILQEDSTFEGKVCYRIIDQKEMSLKEILNWDDYSSWGNFDFGELKDLSKEEIIKELNKFRPGWGYLASKWENMPPIVLVDTLNVGRMIGDGRGRVNLAVGLNLQKLSVIVIKEDPSGDLCFNFQNGIIQHI